MSELLVIRHAQASLFSADYDQLSPRGINQSKALGHALNAIGYQADRLIVGPCKRHQQTASHAKNEIGLPEPEVCAGLAEHRVDEIVVEWIRSGGSRVADCSALIAKYEAAKMANDRQERERAFQRLFELATRHWLAGNEELKIESWLEFQHRVLASFDQIRESTRPNSKVVIVTSVGPISVMLERALQCPTEVAITTGWQVRNCSVTRFLFSGERLTLDLFNSTQHLPSGEITFR